MNREIRDRWVAALRSGDYQQGGGCLRRTTDGEVRHCCLGVLCEIAAAEGVCNAADVPEAVASRWSERHYDNCEATLPQSVVWWADLHDEEGAEVRVTLDDQREAYASLISLNDGEGTFNLSDDEEPIRKPFTFAEIADLIQAQF